MPAPQPKASPQDKPDAPIGSSATFHQDSAAGAPSASSVPAQTSAAPNVAAERPVETRTSTQGAAPAAAAKPAPKPVRANEAAKVPWLRSDNPAGAPATGNLPTQPAPRAPKHGGASAPKPAPAQQAPWESEQVPYDDASIGGFASGGEDDLPPFDVPGVQAAPASKAPAPSASSPAPGASAAPASTVPAAGTPAASAPAPSAPASSTPAPASTAAPWESNPGAGSPFGHQASAPVIPQTEEEAKELVRSVFGAATIFKPVE